MPRHLKGQANGGKQASTQRRPADYGFQPTMSRNAYERNGYNYVPSDYASRKGRKGHHHHVGRVILIIVLALVVLGGLEGFALYRSAKAVKTDAQAVLVESSTLKNSLKTGDTDTLRTTVADISAKADAINQEVHSPAWVVASYVPVYGQDVKSIQTLGNVAVDLSQNALTPFAHAAEGIQFSTLFANGKIDVAALQTLSSSVSDIAPVVQSSQQTIAALPQAHITQVAEAIEKVRSPLTSASTALEDVEQIIPYLPQMLGADGQKRTYLVVGQSNAEMRSSAGFPGSWGTITVTDGQIIMGDFTNIASHRYDTTATADAEELALFGGGLVSNPGCATYNPDFPSTAKLCSSFWSLEGNTETIDGVISFDPIFLQHLMVLTGGYTTSSGVAIDGTNLAKAVLSDAYWDLDATEQDLFFVDVAQGALQSMMDNMGKVGFTDLMNVVKTDSAAHRLSVWMADTDEESAIEAMGLSGEVSKDSSAAPEVGIYINNTSWSKLEWYLDVTSSIDAVTANADGTKTYQVTVNFVNTMDYATQDDLPDYVKAHNPLATSTGTMLENVYVYAPAGGSVSVTETSGGDVGVSDSTTMTGIQVVPCTVSISPQQTTSLKLQVTTSAAATGDLSVRTTPTCTEARQ
jgi:hypothetical protein